MSAVSASPAVGEGLPRIRSVPCSMRFTGRPRLILGDGSTRYETRSSAETCCGGRGWMCAVTTARLASTRPLWRWWRSTALTGSSTRSLRSCGRQVSAAGRSAGVHPEAGQHRKAAAVDPDGPGPGCAGGDQDRARADLRGRHGGLLVRVPPDGPRTTPRYYRRVLAGQTVGGGDRYRELLGCFITLLLRLIVVIKQAVLGFWWLDAQTFLRPVRRCTAWSSPRLTRCNRAGGIRRRPGLLRGWPASPRGVIDEQRADVVGEPDPPGCAGGELFAGDESSPSQRCRLRGPGPVGWRRRPR